MAGYTGRSVRRTPTEATESKVEAADKGPRISLATLIEMLQDYIRHQAIVGKCSIRDVRCPTEEEWSRLACGRRPTLPNDAQMNIYATEAVRRVAKKTRSIRQAYFAIALYRLMHPDRVR